MKKIHHLIVFITTLILALVCAVMMGFVNVNSDMTKYLPKDSQMNHGLKVMSAEFDETAVSMPSMKVMCGALSAEEQQAFHDTLIALPEVSKASFSQAEDGQHVLYQLYVDESIDQKSLGKQIRKQHEQVQLVETSQDGATPPTSVMIISALLIIIILLVMAQSWVEPFIYLATTGVAILLNMGTNALLPSVSITTHSIASILQMVLSIDYCIILTNRYRQKKKSHPDSVDAVNQAIKSAYRPVISSAMTTVVGLLMLCFMRLRIGMDMGIVLAKGVVCSLICTFAVLPSLLVLLEKVIEKSHKKTFVIPTQRLGRFATSHKMPIAISAVVLFCVAFFFSQRTTIFFSAEEESRIAAYFPQPNPFVMIYNTADEDSIVSLAAAIQQDSEVLSVISYPTLLMQPYTAGEMASNLRSMMGQYGDMLDLGDNMGQMQEMITPELVQVLYFMQADQSDTLTIDFPTLTRFIETDCMNNPLFADLIDNTMRSQMALLHELTTETPDPIDEPEELEEDNVLPLVDSNLTAQSSMLDSINHDAPADIVNTPIVSVSIDSSDNPSVGSPVLNVDPTYSLVDFINRLYINRPSSLTMDFRTLADTITLRRIMEAEELSAFIGSSLTQTRLVMNYDKQHRKAMTPLEYMHILTDDLFSRKALNGMITPEQKVIVKMRTGIMDLTNKNTYLTAQQIQGITTRFGVTDVTIPYIDSLMTPKSTMSIAERLIAENSPLLEEDTLPLQSLQIEPLITRTDTASICILPTEQAAPAVTTPSNIVRKRSRAEEEADRKAALFLELMYGGKRYPADRMAHFFNEMGQPVDSSLISLLYTYYGSQRCYPDSIRMSIEEVLRYVSGPLLADSRLTPILPDSVSDIIGRVEGQMQQGVGMLRGSNHSLLVVLTDLPTESAQTYAFVDKLENLQDQSLPSDSYMIGESVMYSEMKKGFNHEMMIVTILTILAIFLIVAVTFRSVIVPAILILTVMTAVYVNVVCCGIISGEMLYLAYLIVQSILMGATIDYGILFANYYREKRRTLPADEAIFESYHGSIRTIMTSGLIMVVAPAAMALLTNNVMIRNIVGSIAIGAFVAIVLILVVLPGILVVFDRWVVHNAAPKHRQEE